MADALDWITGQASQSAHTESKLTHQPVVPGRVPSIDDEQPQVYEYADWKPEDTRIITYNIGAVGRHYRGEYADSRAHADADVVKRFGRVLETNYVLGRAFYRVFKGASNV